MATDPLTCVKPVGEPLTFHNKAVGSISSCSSNDSGQSCLIGRGYCGVDVCADVVPPPHGAPLSPNNASVTYAS